MAKRPFTVQVHHDGGTSGAVRFQVHDGGKATLAFPGHPEAAPSLSGEVEDLDLDALRAGRFIRVDEEGRRRSYQLSRLDRTALLGSASAEWHTLDEANDGGFRYLVLPASGQAAAVAAVQLRPATPRPAAARASGATGGTGLRARAMAAGQAAPAAPAAASAAPPRASASVPTSASAAAGHVGRLTRKALDGLSREQAVAALAEAYDVVGRLEGECARLSRELDASTRRESDLVDLLGKWRSRG